MARPFYPHEIEDPDLDWLISNLLYERPGYVPVESGMLPLILIPFKEMPEVAAEEESETITDGDIQE